MHTTRLLNRDFVLLWQGQLVSQFGNQAFLVAMMFWTMEATGSATVMGFLLATSHLPAAVLGPFGGTFADRHSRVRIIVIADLLRGAAVLVLAAAMWTPLLSSDVQLAILFSIALLTGIVGSVFTPAISAAIPDLVPAERLTAANSLHQTSAQVASLVGQREARGESRALSRRCSLDTVCCACHHPVGTAPLARIIQEGSDIGRKTKISAWYKCC